MSIEKDLTRIAVALEALVQLAANPMRSIETVTPVTAPVAKPTVVETPAAVAPVATAPVATAPTFVAAAPVVTKTPQEMNDLLVAEFNRLGGEAKGAMPRIVAELGKFSASGCSDLRAEDQEPLLAAVRALV